MSFHEVQFPDDISYNTAGGPGFNTSIITLDSGIESRIARWSQPRRKYNVAYGIKDHSQLRAVMTFYIARQGPAYGFRYKDFMDFTTATDHIGTPSDTDVVIGAGDASNKVFQLIKKYTSGTVTRDRTIDKPVIDTTVVALDGTPQASGWAVNTTNGVVTFTVAPGSGVDVTAGCEFDVPVRFSEELDDSLQLSHEAFSIGSIPNIPLVEIASPQAIDGEFHYGGGKAITIAADTSVTLLDGRVLAVSPSTTGLKLILPAESSLSVGGPYFYIKNTHASNTLSIRDSVDVEIKSLTFGTTVVMLIMLDPAEKWVALDA